jgi:hypothetical protein
MSKRHLSVLCILLFTAACSFEETATPPEGWMLGDPDMSADQAMTPDQSTGGDDMPAPADMPAVDQGQNNPDMPNVQDMPVADDMPSRPDMMAPPDMVTTPDMPNPPDMSTMPDMANPPLDMGTAMTGEPCGRNAECSAGLVCCVGLGGGGECQPQAMCLGGQFDGLCEVDAECPGQVCCDVDLGGIAPNVRACQDSCGGVTLACMNNADCAANEVCCPGLNGAECTGRNQCFTGGLCGADTDCQGQQKCCSFAAGVPSVCLDRCSF